MFQSYFHCKYYDINAGNSLVSSSPSVRLSFRVMEEEILQDEAGRGWRGKVLQNKNKSKSSAPEREVKTCEINNVFL